VAIYPIEIASHSFAMTFINSGRLNATWFYPVRMPREEFLHYHVRFIKKYRFCDKASNLAYDLIG